MRGREPRLATEILHRQRTCALQKERHKPLGTDFPSFGDFLGEVACRGFFAAGIGFEFLQIDIGRLKPHKLQTEFFPDFDKPLHGIDIVSMLERIDLVKALLDSLQVVGSHGYFAGITLEGVAQVLNLDSGRFETRSYVVVIHESHALRGSRSLAHKRQRIILPVRQSA